MTAIDCVGHTTRKTIFDVLRIVAWADGRLTGEERAAARGAALAFGIVDMDHQPMERGTRMADIGLIGLSRSERRIVYACASWMALADDVQTPHESLVLHALRERLSLGADEAHRLEDLAHTVRQRFAGDSRRWREVATLVVAAARVAAGPSENGLAA